VALGGRTVAEPLDRLLSELLREKVNRALVNSALDRLI
jgi:hypothetical protein